ncbi:MAG: zinc-ribbon domain-containing protein [Candidatus Odinarchaeota archaeon]
MSKSQKDTIKKIFLLIFKLLSLISFGILILNIFLDINISLLISAIGFLIILFIFSFIFEFIEAKTNNNKEANKIINKWIESEKTEQTSTTIICPKCGQVLYIDTKYCSNCGSILKNN